MIELLEKAILLFGAATMVIQIYLAFRFFARKRVPFARALAGMCVAEALAIFATLVFAASTVIGQYAAMTPAVVLTLRGMIFIPILASTLYLYKQVKLVDNSDGR